MSDFLEFHDVGHLEIRTLEILNKHGDDVHHVDYLGFMSCLSNADKIELTKSERAWLKHVMTREARLGKFSAYDLWKELNEGKSKKEKTWYKVVHQKTSGLAQLNLLEEVMGDRRAYRYRGAIMYKLSVNGWFNVILHDLFRDDELTPPFHNLKVIEKFYEDNIFFKTFLYPHFELATIKAFHKSHDPRLAYTFVNFLSTCCIETLLHVRKRQSTADDVVKRVKKEWESTVSILLDNLVKSMLSRMVLNLVSLNHRFKGTKYSYEIRSNAGKVSIGYHQSPPFDKILKILSEDKKFMNSLGELKVDFDESYSELLKWS